MARYSNKGHDTIRYDITQNITIRYDLIQSESASPYVRTTSCHLQTTAIYGRTYSSKQASAHNTGALPFYLSTLSPLQVPGYWPTGEATVGGRPVPLKSRVIQQGSCEYWPPNNSSCGDSTAAIVWWLHGRRAVARLKYLVIAQSLNI